MEKWQKDLAKLDEEREQASRVALAVAVEKSAKKAVAAQAEVAKQTLAASAAEYQQEVAVEVAKATSASRRKAQWESNKGKNSPFGHRAGSEGYDFDVAIARYIKANDSWPTGADLRKFADLFEFDLKRLDGHLNHVQRVHKSLIPEHLRK